MAKKQHNANIEAARPEPLYDPLSGEDENDFPADDEVGDPINEKKRRPRKPRGTKKKPMERNDGQNTA